MKTLLADQANLLARFASAVKKRAKSKNSPLVRLLVDSLLLPQDLISAFGPLRRVKASPWQLMRPRSFNGQLARWKFTNRRSHHQTLADKLAVRSYVAETIGEQYLCKLYWSGTKITEPDFAKLPSSFVFKSNHASGAVEIVADKSNSRREHLQQLGDTWLAEDYSLLTGEWQYRWIEPLLLAEEYLDGPDGQPPPDNKMWIFEGRFAFVQVDYDRFRHHTRTFYDRDLNVLPFSVMYPNSRRELEPPPCFDQMIDLAEALTGDEKFARVDMYAAESGHRPVFGEITLFPGNGGESLQPTEWDSLLWQKLIRDKLAFSQVAATTQVRGQSAQS